MGRWPIAGLALCMACSATEAPVFLDLGQLDRDFVVLASLSDSDRVDESFVIDWRQAAPLRAQISVGSGHRLVGAAFDRSELLDRSPRLAEERLAEFGFEPVAAGAATCPEGVLDSALDQAQIRWPEGTVGFEWLLSEERLVTHEIETHWSSRLTPVAPVRADRCAGHPDLQIRAFASRQPILGSGSIVGGQPIRLGNGDLLDFVRLDEQRVIALYPGHVVMAEHGLGFIDEPGRSLASDVDWSFRALSVGAPDPETGAQRLLIASAIGPTSVETTRSRVQDATVVGHQLTLGPVILDTTGVVDGVYVHPETGRAIVYERPGQIYADSVVSREMTRVNELPDNELETDKRGRLVPTRVPAYPVALVASRTGALYLGSADGTEWIAFNEGLSPGITLRGFGGLALSGEASWLFGGNSAGQVFRRRFGDEAWTRVDVRVDPALIPAECAGVGEPVECGFGTSKLAWQHVTGFVDSRGEPAALAFSDLCSLAFIIRGDGCASHLTVDALGPILRTSEDEILLGRSEAGFVTIATEAGSLFEIPWSELGLEP